jgi:hypothetical protein
MEEAFGGEEDVGLVFGDLVHVVLFGHIAEGGDLKSEPIAYGGGVGVDE